MNNDTPNKLGIDRNYISAAKSNVVTNLRNSQGFNSKNEISSNTLKCKPNVVSSLQTKNNIGRFNSMENQIKG